MDLSGIPPPVMNWDASNLPEEWQKFKLHIEPMFWGPLKSKTEEEKYRIFFCGSDKKADKFIRLGQVLWTMTPKNWTLTMAGSKTMCNQNLNPIFVRYRFNNEVQVSDSIDAFVTRLKLRAQDCSYAECDNMIRHKIVFGCSSEKLINEGEKLTLDKVMQIVQNNEYCQKQLSSMAPYNQQTTRQRSMSQGATKNKQR